MIVQSEADTSQLLSIKAVENIILNTNLSWIGIPSKHEAFNQWWINVGPTWKTVGQR